MLRVRVQRVNRVKMVRSVRGAEGVQGAEGEGAKGVVGAKCTICRGREWTWCGSHFSLKSSIYKSKDIFITLTLAFITFITFITRFTIITFITSFRTFITANSLLARISIIGTHE